MGLTTGSIAKNAVHEEFMLQRKKDERVIALAGNPNVGKSTVFNELTGMNQHTGNWPGKTVCSAQGSFRKDGKDYTLVDLPGTYSLFAHSAEEEVARDFICFGGADAVIVVCDATCLERNLNLVLQTLEITSKTVVCLNLCDEARRKGILVDSQALSRLLRIPVVETVARTGEGLNELLAAVDAVCEKRPLGFSLNYTVLIERAINAVVPVLKSRNLKFLPARWLALRLLDGSAEFLQKLEEFLGYPLTEYTDVQEAVNKACAILSGTDITDKLVAGIILTAEGISADCVSLKENKSRQRDQKIDRILTSRLTGIPIMLLMLCGVFFITISGANIPSNMLSSLLTSFEAPLFSFLQTVGASAVLCEALVYGGYRVLAWVVSVMLPPMAIFFPLFTLLEDSGYLPRIAFNLDHFFQKAKACGKQALTMCMGFGCNAAGVVGCRIIDSLRERLIAILTNNFVPCNGRFPTLIAMISMFFVTGGMFSSLLSALLLMVVIVFGVAVTFWVSRLLSATLLKGIPSSFTLELPPYRRPQIGKVLIRSLLDRTLFVLGRAAVVALPAGLLLWVLAAVNVGGQSLLVHFSSFLNPLGKLMGLDGVILAAFVLGFPANEIVLPIIMMIYVAGGTIAPLGELSAFRMLLIANGWTAKTALCLMLFSLLHWPCSTTCLTIKKETGSWKWTGLSVLIPTGIGIIVCMAANLLLSFLPL